MPEGRARGGRRRALAAPAAVGDVRETLSRSLGVPALFAIATAAIGSSIYFSLGIVGRDAGGLTPVVLLLAGGFFVVTMMSYVEGSTLHAERGGASTLARYAFNELWSFVAGWAILLDYVIVMAIGAIAISHYLTAFWAPAGDPGIEVLVGAAAIAFVVVLNIRGLGPERLGFVLRAGLANLALLLAIVTIGLFQNFDVGRITATVELGTSPRWTDLLFAAVFACVALTGIEAASGLASEIRVGRRALRRVVGSLAVVVLALFVGVSLVALGSTPVTPLGVSPFVEAPMLGVVTGWEPEWLGTLLRYTVGVLAAIVLLTALNVVMLGLSRLAYSLATNRQIPTALGRLHPRHSTPAIAIAIAGTAVLLLVAAADLDFLAGLFAFGAMLTFTIAHVSVIALRFRERDFPRPFRVPLNVRVRGVAVPLPAVLGAVVAALAWVSVVVLHEGARNAGTVWMVGGVALYVTYRRAQNESITRRHTVSERALQEAPEIEYGSLLVPVFGSPLDDDIVGTAGRLAAEQGEAGEGGAMIEALYVIEMPMSLPLDARVPEERLGIGRRALARAKEVGEEYANVEVATATVRARSAGAAIVEEARRRGVEAIVLAADEPARIRGGAGFGGRGAGRDRFVGEMTKHVIEKAPCRVILTAPPPGEEGDRAGVRP